MSERDRDTERGAASWRKRRKISGGICDHKIKVESEGIQGGDKTSVLYRCWHSGRRKKIYFREPK